MSASLPRVCVACRETFTLADPRETARTRCYRCRPSGMNRTRGVAGIVAARPAEARRNDSPRRCGDCGAAVLVRPDETVIDDSAGFRGGEHRCRA